MRPELHILASHRGAARADEPTDCAICGESPFPFAGPKAKVLGPNFTSFEHICAASDICKGCEALMAGKPGSEPPPRSGSSAAMVSGLTSERGLSRVCPVSRVTW